MLATFFIILGLISLTTTVLVIFNFIRKLLRLLQVDSTRNDVVTVDIPYHVVKNINLGEI